MKKIEVMGLFLLIGFTQIQSVSACNIAVESFTEEVLLKATYQFTKLKLTTNTAVADIGIRLSYIGTTASDPEYNIQNKS